MIPVPENALVVAPVTKPVPVTVMFWLLAPWPRALGLVEVTVGRVLTVNTPVPVAVLLSGLVTVTLPGPVLALAVIVMLAFTWVELT